MDSVTPQMWVAFTLTDRNGMGHISHGYVVTTNLRGNFADVQIIYGPVWARHGLKIGMPHVGRMWLSVADLRPPVLREPPRHGDDVVYVAQVGSDESGDWVWWDAAEPVDEWADVLALVRRVESTQGKEWSVLRVIMRHREGPTSEGAYVDVTPVDY